MAEVEGWPLPGLRLRTPRLLLRWTTEEDLHRLGHVVASSDLSREVSVPFLVRAKKEGASVGVAQRALLQFHWSRWALLGPAQWDLTFTVEQDGDLVGLQTLRAEDFRVVREVSSGAWTIEAAQGRGIAGEAHCALLELAFGHLGALSATNGSFASNPASGAASRRVGYVEDGLVMGAVDGERVEGRRFRMTKDRWRQVRADWPAVEVEGLEPCLDVLGLGVPS